MTEGPSRISLTVNVRQALKAEDTRQLSLLIMNCDAKTISSTAKELTSEEAALMIERIGTSLAAEPKHLQTAILWVSELVTSHMAFIASQNRTKDQLRPILEHLNQRLSHHSDIVEMRQMTQNLIQIASSNSGATQISTPTNEPLHRWTVE